MPKLVMYTRCCMYVQPLAFNFWAFLDLPEEHVDGAINIVRLNAAYNAVQQSPSLLVVCGG